jgi:small subunit ribosomal protein S17
MAEFGTNRKMVGTVISDRMQKTVVVEVKRRVLHQKYKKYITKRNRFKAHDEKDECGVGDRVLVAETRPLSAQKRWKVVRVIEKSKGVDDLVKAVEQQ